MKNQEKASVSIMKILCVSIILILISGIGVMAVNTNLKDVKIILSNGYELTALTGKTTVEEVLDENNILLEDNQKTIPEEWEEIKAGTVVKIVDKSYNEVQIAKVSEEGVEATLEQLLDSYAPITERIVTVEEEIPFETITKNSLGTEENTTSRVLQQGENGLKEVVYKIKYQNEIEIEKILLSEKVIKEPVNKIIQVSRNVSSRAGSTTRTIDASVPEGAQIYKVTAYCPCAKCCGKTNGITALGTHATEGRTVAASSRFSFGTKLNINGHIYTVEDRGGAINGNKIDIFVNSHAQALAWGVRYLPVSVVNE